MTNIVEIYDESASDADAAALWILKISDIKIIVFYDTPSLPSDKNDFKSPMFVFKVKLEKDMMPISFVYKTEEARKVQYEKLINAWKGN